MTYAYTKKTLGPRSLLLALTRTYQAFPGAAKKRCGVGVVLRGLTIHGCNGVRGQEPVPEKQHPLRNKAFWQMVKPL